MRIPAALRSVSAPVCESRSLPNSPLPAEIPVLFRREVDSGGVSESAQGPAILVNAPRRRHWKCRRAASSRPRPGCPGCREAAARCLSARFKRIVQVITGPLGIEKASPDLAAGSEVSVGRPPRRSGSVSSGDRSRHADATIAFTTAACRDRVLAEAIGAPGGAGNRTSPARPRPCARLYLR